MKIMRRSRWLARLAATLTVGVVGLMVAASAPAQAGIAFQSHVVASWGDGFDGDLGNGTTDIRPQYGDSRLRPGTTSAWRCGPTAPSGRGETTGRASWATAPGPTGAPRVACWDRTGLSPRWRPGG